MFRFTFALILVGAVSIATGCGDDSGTADSGITLFDADTTPDAELPPDAFVCTETMCDTECVDITTDVNHCTGCMMPCTQAGAVCNNGCECPASFIPEGTLTPFFDMITNMILPAPDLTGLAPFGLSEINALTVSYNPNTIPIDTPIDLSMGTFGVTPFVGALYDLDMDTFVPRSAYLATEGTLTVHYACAEGISVTLTDATFAAADILNMQPPPKDACTFDVTSVSVDIADPCMSMADAGPSNFDATPSP
jgi:hypothetical protein